MAGTIAGDILKRCYKHVKLIPTLTREPLRLYGDIWRIFPTGAAARLHWTVQAPPGLPAGIGGMGTNS